MMGDWLIWQYQRNTAIKNAKLSDSPLRDCIHPFPCIPGPKITTAVGLISGWLVFQKTKAGNARKRYASSPTSTRALLITEVINESST